MTPPSSSTPTKDTAPIVRHGAQFVYYYGIGITENALRTKGCIHAKAMCTPVSTRRRDAGKAANGLGGRPLPPAPAQSDAVRAHHSGQRLDRLGVLVRGANERRERGHHDEGIHRHQPQRPACGLNSCGCHWSKCEPDAGGRELEVTMLDPEAARAICTAPMRRVALPKVFAIRTRTRSPPMLVCSTSRKVWFEY
jgi:hypothetical protein